MRHSIQTDTTIVFSSKFKGKISRLAARRDGVCDTHFGSKLRDSKRIGKFAADVGARREALDMYPRERRKQADTAKSPTLFERNARCICVVNDNHAR